MDITFTPEQLNCLRQLEHKRPFLSHLLTGSTDLTDTFTRWIFSIEEPKALAFDLIMRTYSGDPSGVEFAHTSAEGKWACIVPDLEKEGGWCIRYFDRRSFVGHHCEPNLVKSVNDQVDTGYTKADPGVLNALCRTDEWNRGVEVNLLLLQLNSGQIDQIECMKRTAALPQG